MIEIDNVTKRFGRFEALRGVTLGIERGESVALWGANGAGKSTLIRCLLGLIRFRGHIRVAGLDVRRSGKRVRAMVGYVPQELGFYDDLRVHEAVSLFARLKGIRRADTGLVLERVALGGHERKRIRELSGGMKQRLALAIALLGDPPVLVLDEVTASLDTLGREELVHVLKGLKGEGRTMLFASHRPDEVASLGSRVVVMREGRVDHLAGPQEFQAPPAAFTMKLRVGADDANAAVVVLRAAGFEAARNGVGVSVPLTPGHKAVPVRLLAEARIPIEDFELHAGAAPGAPHEGGCP